MSELYAEPNKTDEILPAVFAPSTCWIIAILLVMGPLLQAIEFLLESGMDTMWRSPYVPRLAVPFTLAFAILDFAAGKGLISHLVNLLGFVILAVAVWRGYSRASGRSTAPAAQPGS